MLRLVVDTLFPDVPRGAALAYVDRPGLDEILGGDRCWPGTTAMATGGSSPTTATAWPSAEAAARGWHGDELTINRDILILANPEIAGMPAWVAALVAAGGIAAALSTAAGLVMAIASAVSHDLVRGRSIRRSLSRRALHRPHRDGPMRWGCGTTCS